MGVQVIGARQKLKTTTALFVVSLLAACGGGGSGPITQPPPIDPADPVPPTPPIDPTDPPVLPEPPDTGLSPSDFETSEYNLNWGLAAIHASTRYAQNLSGAGTLTAVMDTGATSVPDLEGRIRQDLSWSYMRENSNVTDIEYHGTHVACTIACAKNDQGTHGVSYGTDLMILQGIGASANMPFSAMMRDLSVRTIRADADIVNHSWSFRDENDQTLVLSGGETRSDYNAFLGSATTDALVRMAQNDIVQVFAAGNSGLDQPNFMGGMAEAIPEMDGYVITAVAIDRNDQIASFSNQCGVAMNHCLAAPGVSIAGSVPTETFSSGLITMSGTSSAAPHIVGAHNILREAFPELTGAEVTYVLYGTARDLGDAGVDPIYGRGALDIDAALTPQGPLSFQVARVMNAETSDAAQSVVVGRGAFGQALRAGLDGHDVLVTDGYNRGFALPGQSFVTVADTLGVRGAALRETARGPAPSFEVGALQFSIDQNGMGGESDVHALSLHTPGSFAIAQDLGGVEVRGFTAFSGKDAEVDGNYMKVELSGAVAGVQLSAGLSSLTENGGVLGGSLSGAFGRGAKSASRIASFSAEAPVLPAGTVAVTASLGETDFSTQGYLSQGRASTHSFGAAYTHKGVFGASDSLSLGLSQPLSITSGSLAFDRPIDLRPASNGARDLGIDSVQSDIDLNGARPAPDLSVAYRSDIGASASLSATALHSFETHGTQVGLDFSWRF